MQPPSVTIPPINQPVTLVAVGIFSVLVLAGLHAIFSLAIWLLFVLIFLVLLICAVTIFVIYKLPQLQLESPDLLRYHLQQQFRDFKEDAVQGDIAPAEVKAAEATREAGEDDGARLERNRVEEYEKNRGLFLVHTWQPSNKDNQVADVVIRLHEHLDTPKRRSLLAEGKVARVTYEMGRNFFAAPVPKENVEENFALDISAYSPALCLAEVTFNDGSPPVILSRYIDFPVVQTVGRSLELRW